jgi:glycosyltransferase involved in cell wall biosynthesis
MPLFVRAADAIIAVSGQTRRDLIELYNVPAAKIHVIYQGIDERFAPIGPAGIDTVRQRYGIERPYWLMVGTLEPRKNHAAALRALARLKANGFPHCLVVAGGAGWLFDPIRTLVGELGLSDDVIFTGRVPDADLPALYSGADCFLMPSLYEGFGFPVLEAMACGTPVVCSNSSSLPEVAGDAALMVDPEDDGALAAAVGRLLAEPDLRSQLRQRGEQQAAGFRWQECAAQTVQVYAAVVEA